MKAKKTIGYLLLAIISFLCPGKHPGSDSFLNDRTPVHAAEAPGQQSRQAAPFPWSPGRRWAGPSSLPPVPEKPLMLCFSKSVPQTA